jgi:hypothetical protein
MTAHRGKSPAVDEQTESAAIGRSLHPPNRLIHRLVRVADNAYLRPRRLAQLGDQIEPLDRGKILMVLHPLLQVLRHITLGKL